MNTIVFSPQNSSETGHVLTIMKAGDFFGEIGILNLDGFNKYVLYVFLFFFILRPCSNIVKILSLSFPSLSAIFF